MADAILMWSIAGFLILLAVVLPFFEAAFSNTQVDNNPDVLEANVGQSDLADVSIFDIASSIFKMFFWVTGVIPLVLELILIVPLKIMFVWLIARAVRGVG